MCWLGSRYFAVVFSLMYLSSASRTIAFMLPSPPASRSCKELLSKKDQNGATTRRTFEKRWDVVCRQMVSRMDLNEWGPGSARSIYGRPDLYAMRKRQLGTQELQHYGVTNKGRDSRPCLLVQGLHSLASEFAMMVAHALCKDAERMMEET